MIDRTSESQRCSGEVTSSAELLMVRFFSHISDQNVLADSGSIHRQFA